MNRRCRTLTLVGSLWLLAAASASALACNIPVFRYALERWQPDAYQLLVVHREPLAEGDLTRIEELRTQSQSQNGDLNLDVRTVDLKQELDPDLAAMESVLNSLGGDGSSPRAILRSAPVQGDRLTLWQGELDEFNPAHWFESPIRTKVLERLLAGDSGVWIVFPGTDSVKTDELVNLLETELERLGDELPFPSGIGEPGSELFSEVPLTIRFSVLRAEPEAEGALRSLLKTVTNADLDAGQPIVVPVYGRARALEAFEAEQVTPQVIEEISMFFTGACSCQVKQSNPGFDLPLSAAWMPLLFQDVAPPPETQLPENGQGKAEYVSIPAGTLAREQAAEAAVPETPLDVPVTDAVAESKVEPLPAVDPAQPIQPPLAVEILRSPSEARPVKQNDPFVRWIAMAAVVLGAVLILAAGRR